MSSLAREEWPGRFQVRDNPEAKIWDHRPPASVLDQWREHVRTTGMPDSFEYHCHSPPPTDEQPVIVAFSIDVPESLRAQVGKAPCPKCCLHFPKYSRGVIAWYRNEKALRAIGHECGDDVVAARERAEARQRAETAADYLIEMMPSASAIREWLDTVFPIARGLDKAMAVFMRGIGATAVKSLYRGSEGQKLSLVEERTVEVQSHKGGQIRTETVRLVLTLRKSGAHYLNWSVDPISR